MNTVFIRNLLFKPVTYLTTLRLCRSLFAVRMLRLEPVSCFLFPVRESAQRIRYTTATYWTQQNLLVD